VSEVVQRIPYEGTGEDSHGNEVESWGDPVTLSGVYGFDPGSSSEPRIPGQDRVIVEPTLYGPYDMPVESDDRVVVRGDTYEVEGFVRRWKHMRSGRLAGAVATLRRVSG
jgi:hypothetical protein